MLDSPACPLLDGREKPAPACKALLLAALPPAVQLALGGGWPGLPLLGSPNTELLAGAVHLGGVVSLSELDSALTWTGRPWGEVGKGRQEGGSPVSVRPSLGHLHELKGCFSVFSFSYREGSPAVVSSCFPPKCWWGGGGVLALC